MRTAPSGGPPTRRRSPIVPIGALFAVLVSLCFWAPAALAAPATGSVTVVGETGSYVTGGHAYRFDSDSGSVSLSSAGYTNGPSVAAVEASGDGSTFWLSFAAPAGQTLQTGEYANATRYPFETAGQPGIDVTGNGGCNEEFGSFDVRDVHLDASGNVDRLWLVYEVRCESTGAADVFGEVRLNEPATGSAAYSEPTTVQWPGIDLARPARVVPVRIFAGATDRTVASVALTGPGAPDFSMRLDQCTGQTLPAGTSCDVFPRYDPTAAGASRDASLAVTMTDASVIDIPLAGFAYGGTTEMALQSDPGDWIGGGMSSRYDESNADITASGSRESLSFSVAGDDGSDMTADFVAGHNDILVPGSTYVEASRYPFNNTGTGMDVSGNGHGCNTLSGQFTITDLAFDPAGNLLDAGVTFVQHCEDGTPALRGIFEWRARTPAVLAPWNISLPTVLGTPIVGATLEADPGSWSPAGVALSYTYQWLRCDGSGAACAAIPSATGPTYTPTSQDAQQTLEVMVTALDAGGSSETQTSTVTGLLAALGAPTGPSPSAPSPITAPGSSSLPLAVAKPATSTQQVSTNAPAAIAPSGQQAASASSTPAALTQTISVPGRQSARTVGASGLRVTVRCSQDCAASVSVRGATASASAHVSLRAGVSKTVRVRLHGGSLKRLTVTGRARRTKAPAASAPTVTRHLVLA